MTATTATITDFLLARLAEKEAGATTVRPATGFIDSDGNALSGTVWETDTRVLAEVEAHRRIVERAMDQNMHEDWFEIGPVMDEVLGHLASVYADHPDYREEWAQ